MQGKVKHYNSEKSYGFISTNGQEDIFFHIADVKGTDIKKGDIVEYTIKEAKRGMEAENIVVIVF